MDDKEFTSRVLSPAETEAALGDFHRQTRDYKGARLLIEQALKDNSGLGYAHEQMGFLLFNAGKDAEAAEEFAKAYALDGTLHLSLFAKTMLSPVATSDVPADRNAFHDALLKVVEVNPQFAPAFVQLARLALRNSDPQTAFRVARRAEQLEPSRAGYHLLTGHILLRLGKMAEAAAIARFVADRWAGPDHNEAVELWNRVPEMLRGPSEAVFVSAPEETHTATGTLKSVNCDAPDKSAALVLTHEGKLLAFRGKGSFSVGVPDTLWYGGDHFTLCHHLGGARAVVHYRPASDTSYAGDISEIEVRDDLPETPTAPQ